MTARYTSQAAVEIIGNRYDLVLIASIRARELKRGYKPLINTVNKPIVTALNEIEQGKIGIEYLKKVKKPR
jgi:DNA-directed RNA polymerase subunit omega